MQPKEFFISGIDTNCGKTYCTGLLAKHLQKNYRLITTKLIQTGCVGISEDIIEHRKLMEVDLMQEDIDGRTCPIVLSFPASPHLAAEIDKTEIDLSLIRNSIEELKKDYELILTEGAGGLMVPISKDYLTINYIKDNQLPLILIGSSKLGSINHSLLSLELCKSFGINLHSFIYNHLPDSDELISADTFLYLQSYLQVNFPKTKLYKSEEIEFGNFSF